MMLRLLNLRSIRKGSINLREATHKRKSKKKRTIHRITCRSSKAPLSMETMIWESNWTPHLSRTSNNYSKRSSNYRRLTTNHKVGKDLMLCLVMRVVIRNLVGTLAFRTWNTWTRKWKVLQSKKLLITSNSKMIWIMTWNGKEKSLYKIGNTCLTTLSWSCFSQTLPILNSHPITTTSKEFFLKTLTKTLFPNPSKCPLSIRPS